MMNWHNSTTTEVCGNDVVVPSGHLSSNTYNSTNTNTTTNNNEQDIIRINVDVIIPVHNSMDTIAAAVHSAMKQVYSENDTKSSSGGDEIMVEEFHLHNNNQNQHPLVEITIYVCCYDDGSTDSSWCILKELQSEYESNKETNKNDSTTPTTIPTNPDHKKCNNAIQSFLCIESSLDGCSRGAGYSRNRAVAMRSIITEVYNERYLCLLDSDDTMYCTRVMEQVHYFRMLRTQYGIDRSISTLVGCTFNRFPDDSTWHYTQWANTISDERLLLERFREVTIIQPTWMLHRIRFEQLSGYIEAPPTKVDSRSSGSSSTFSIQKFIEQNKESRNPGGLLLIHPQFDTIETLRLAEDLRFFHAHVHDNGSLRLLRSPSSSPLVTYTHRVGTSQSTQTSRKLLIQLRTMAFEKCILESDPNFRMNNNNNKSTCGDTDSIECPVDGAFVVWGAGRDGKEFIKSLHPNTRSRVYCVVDVDVQKINRGYYINHEMNIEIPIVHFSLLKRRKKISINDSCTTTTTTASTQVLLPLCQFPNKIEGTSTSTTTEESGIGTSISFGRINKRQYVVNTTEQEVLVTSNKTNAKESIFSTSQTIQPKRIKNNTDNNCCTTTDSNWIYTSAGCSSLKLEILPFLPVVVCVSMYRTQGALEANVRSIGRTEGIDLWHFM